MRKEKKTGRPTLYQPEYCERLIEHMADGLSFEAFGGVVKVSKQTLYDWLEAQPPFLDAKKRAETQSQLFWERVGLEGMYKGGIGDPFNATVWIFNMKNRFGWADSRKIEHSGPGGGPIQSETNLIESRRKAEDLLKQLIEDREEG